MVVSPYVEQTQLLVIVMAVLETMKKKEFGKIQLQLMSGKIKILKKFKSE